VTDTGTFHLPETLPAVVEHQGRPPPFLRTDPDAGFLSQLIAERNHLPVQRPRRRVPLVDAIVAYDAGERRDARRLPQGFFRSAEA
jgi:hypothetical protein